MWRWYRGVILTAAVALVLVLASGCATHERRKVSMTEERHESEVLEESPGQMIVE